MHQIIHGNEKSFSTNVTIIITWDRFFFFDKHTIYVKHNFNSLGNLGNLVIIN